MTKRLWRAALPLGCLAAGFLLARWDVLGRHGPRPDRPRDGPTIEQVRQLSSLVTTRVEVADVRVGGIRGRTGGVRTVVVLKGDLLLGVDLSAARLEASDPAARAAVLVLPPPAVTSPRVDHEGTRLFAASETGLWQLVPGDAAYAAAVDEAFYEAQRAVGRAGDDPSLHAGARRRAEQVVRCFFAALGWDVAVKWSDNLPPKGGAATVRPE